MNIISACRPQDNKEAQQKFQEISTAYDTLRDPQKRSMYDRVGPEGVEEGGGMGGFGVSFLCSGSAHLNVAVAHPVEFVWRAVPGA